MAAQQKSLNDALSARIAEIDVALETLAAEVGKPARKVDETALREKVPARLAGA